MTRNTILHTGIVLLFASAIIYCQEWGNCYDEEGETTCYYWRINGMCNQRNYRNYMYRICRRTCNLCPSKEVTPYPVPTTPIPYKPCHDVRDKCPNWKEFCQPGNEYHVFMKKHCRRTCLVCADPNCKDLNSRCSTFKAAGYCHNEHRYFNYMRKSCQKSCEFCVRNNTDVIDYDGKKPVQIEKYFKCDFEQNECDWWNRPFEDNADWAVGVDPNGPKHGYNGSAKYLYAETPHRGYRAKLWLPWQLILPDGGLKSLGNMCFHFVYQITNGRLTVHQTPQPTLHEKSPNPQTLLETLEYRHGWTRTRLNVKADPQFYLTVIGHKGVSDSYIALDDFYFTKGAC